jgi:16S rRNA (guanine527-N7)-methyltransferase
MRALLERSGIRLRPEQLAALWEFHRFLRARNAADDLTRLVGFESIVVKHYVDSMIVGSMIRLPSPLLDLGTGAGFPGIPLKIRYPRIRLVLVDTHARRVAFLRDACDLLQLRDVTVLKLKATRESLREPVAGVITRAFERIAATVDRTAGCLDRGGELIFLKGPSVDEELEEALDVQGDRVTLERDEAYSLPHTTHRRRLIVLRRR